MLKKQKKQIQIACSVLSGIQSGDHNPLSHSTNQWSLFPACNFSGLPFSSFLPSFLLS